MFKKRLQRSWKKLGIENVLKKKLFEDSFDLIQILMSKTVPPPTCAYSNLRWFEGLPHVQEAGKF